MIKSAVESLESRLFLSASDLDTTFGQNGQAIGNFGDASRFVDVQLLPDGKVLAIGSRDLAAEVNGFPARVSDFLVARYTADGQLDTTFGNGAGFVVTDFAPGGGGTSLFSDTARALTLLPDGDFVVVGDTENRTTTEYNIAIARYNADGSLDTSFSGDGKVVTVVPGANSNSVLNSAATAVTLTANGKILIAGSSSGRTGDDGPARFTLARYNTDGTLDTAFGTNGLTTTQFIYFQLEIGQTVADIPALMNATDLAVLPNGKILLGGTADVAYDYGIDQQSFALARYNANGSLDTTFAEQGWATGIYGNSVAGNFVIRPDGSIVIAGDLESYPANMALARFTSAGVRDLSFGNDTDGHTEGFATATFRSPVEDPFAERSRSTGRSVIALPNGQLLVTGYTTATDPDSTRRLAMARFTSDGELDSSFATDGKLDSASLSTGQASLLQPDGKVIVAGSLGSDGESANEQAGLIRFQALGTASVSGTIYNDANQNGTQESSEAPLVGWTAYVDYNNNGKIDESEPFALTDANGAYTISGLAAGSYRIREIRQSGWTRSQPGGAYPAGYYDLTLGVGQVLTASNFGNYEQPQGAPPPANTAPTAAADTATTTEDSPVTIDVLANDTDDNQLDPGSVTVTTAPAHGTAVVNPVTGVITFLPTSGYSGSDTFAYTVADDEGVTSAPATVTLNVTTATLGGTATGTLPASSVGGEKAKAKVAVSLNNQTSALVNGQVALSLFLSEDATLDAGDAQVLDANRRLRIQPGKAKNIKLSVKSFPQVSPETYQLLTRVTSPDGSVAVLPSGSLVILDPYVDLTASVTKQPVTPLVTSSRGSMTLEIRNGGNVFARGSTTIDVYASSDTTLDEDDRLIATIPTKLKIKPAGLKKQVLRFDVPSDLASGSVTLIAAVNPDATIVERNNDNNTASSDVLQVG